MISGGDASLVGIPSASLGQRGDVEAPDSLTPKLDTLLVGNYTKAVFIVTVANRGRPMKLDMWDYLTFLCFFVIGTGFLVTLVFVLGLPGRIARARKHPEAEAIDMMGWVGFLAVVPWIQAFVWAFKPTDVIDIRRFPKEEQAALEQEAREYAEANAPRRSKKKLAAAASAPSQEPSAPTASVSSTDKPAAPVPDQDEN